MKLNPNMFLILLLTISIFSILGGSSWVSGVLENTDYQSELIESGETNTGAYENIGFTFEITSLTGSLAVIMAIAFLGALIGFQFLGSGLSETSVKVILTALAYYGAWASLSFLAIDFIFSIPYSIGFIIWVVLTLLFTLGIISRNSGGGDE